MVWPATGPPDRRGVSWKCWTSSTFFRSNSFREQLDTGGPLDRAIVIIIGPIVELERGLIVERVKAGTRIILNTRARDSHPYRNEAKIVIT